MPPESNAPGALLRIEALTVRHGAVEAVSAVSFAVGPGEAVALLGANGAGKSSVLRAIMGLLRPADGTIRFEGRPLAGGPERRARAGIGYAPEGRRPFPGLTVRENLEVAATGQPGERAARIEAAFALFPALAARAASLGWQLSGGEAQMLAVARAMMNRPRLLLLDEPSLGLAPRITADLIAALRRIAAQGTALLVAEEKAATGLELCRQAIVLRRGRVADAAGTAELDAERLRRAYFG